MDIRKKQRLVVDALEDVKARDIMVFNTAAMPSMFERVVIASGESNRQLRALSERVKQRIKEDGGTVYGVEGESGGEWVLVDLGDIVVHIMHPTVRGFYNLEEVWGEKKVALKKDKPAFKAKAKARPKKKAAARGPAARPRGKR
jgi:ribosome-associated protein